MLTFFCSSGNSKKVWSLLSPLLNSGAYYSWDPGGGAGAITLLPHFMNKGDIITFMQKRLHIKAENTLVAGDGSNDLSMFNPGIARWAVCPANADSRIKKAVRVMSGIVARKRYSWGVIEAVRKIMPR
jgi:hydroxymethylpyrimidine pyrophosphatase-like HAD family hydrolase